MSLKLAEVGRVVLAFSPTPAVKIYVRHDVIGCDVVRHVIVKLVVFFACNQRIHLIGDEIGDDRYSLHFPDVQP